jgi:hypothetical protein
VLIGHTAIALVAKRARPSIPLAALIAATYGPDVIEITLLALGRWAHVYAAFASHSIPSVTVGAAVVAAAYWVWRGDAAGAALVGATYASHWAADLFTGSGKPTWGGGPTLGLSLYDQPALDFVVESGMLLVAWMFFWPRGERQRRPRAVHVAAPIALVLVQLVFNASERLFGVRSIKGAVSSAPGRDDAFSAGISRADASAQTRRRGRRDHRPARRMPLA